jgi:acyl-CoA thioesterase
MDTKQNIRPEIMEGIRKHIAPLGQLEKAELLEISPGHARVKIDIKEDALNFYGNLHGGFIFSLCDMVAGMSAYAYEFANVTQQASINFLRAYQTGTLYAEGNAVHKGRHTVVVPVTVSTEEGKLIASATVTMFLVSPLS